MKRRPVVKKVVVVKRVKRPPDRCDHDQEGDVVKLLKLILVALKDIQKELKLIMATNAELKADLDAVSAQVAKIGTETSATLQKVTDLENALANAGGTTPEVDAAMAALKAQVQLVDDLVPDAGPAPTPNA